MPYIKKEKRFKPGEPFLPSTPGEYNYAITLVCLKMLGPEPKYEDYSRVVAALECAKLEFYRRSVAPYEDKKIKENGDVYPG